VSAIPAWELLRGYALPVTEQPPSRIPAELAAELPADTSAAGLVPAGVRLELTGTAAALSLSIDAAGPLQRAAPTMPCALSIWLGTELTSTIPVQPGSHTVEVRLPKRGASEIVTIYLPDGLESQLGSVSWEAGSIRPAPPRPRWLAYGDSITQGWSATDPGRTWTAIAGRTLGLDVVNLGFAGAARGELASATQLARSQADVISLAFGTNCWATRAFSTEMMAEVCNSFLGTVRAGHPEVWLLVLSPIVRPDAEHAANARGATLGDLRAAMEEAVGRYLTANHDARVLLLRGAGLVSEELLVDGIHPGDRGHEVMARAVSQAMSGILR